MKWFRSNIRHGSRLALLALAVQLVLSFGHFHADVAQAATVLQSGPAHSDRVDVRGLDAGAVAASAVADRSTQPQPGPDADGRLGDTCAICAVMAMAHTVLFATPPVLLLPQAVEILHLTVDAAFVHIDGAHASFQPRAPPIS
jgi:hypothetical protein